MDWSKLLSEKKFAEERIPEPKQLSDYPISEFEKDYKKIVADANFRRLQDKTQVFPLDKSDFVRTRLTHSIEVSTIAKQLGVMIYSGYERFSKSKEFPMNKEHKHKICDILMCSGLLHDLGNPPFGHFGETVIRDWFRNILDNEIITYKGKPLASILSNQMCMDFKNFEGNAQSFRILTKYNNTSSNNNLNLTYAVIQSLMKYPVNSENFSSEDADIKMHKNGYFLAEQELLKKIASKTGTINGNEIFRHPLTFILEAADDIAYATADLEDAFKKSQFTIDEFIAFYDKTLESLSGVSLKPNSKELINVLRDRATKTIEDDFTAFSDWVKIARDWLMYCAAFGFTNNYTAIMSGTYKYDLFHDTFHRFSIKTLKKVMSKFVYNSDNILRLELSASTIISSLLDRFIPAAIYYNEKSQLNKLSDIDNKYINLISDNYKEDYLRQKNGDESHDLYLRLLMVCDYISSMTDSFAKNLYQELLGIN